MDPVVVAVFCFVYLGMMLGGLPGLRLDRTGVALLGAITLVASGRITLDEAWSAIDVPTVALLLGLMVVSAQFRLGGFYSWTTRALGRAAQRPSHLLASVVAASAGLSAVLANDIVCLAMAPVLIEVCTQRRLNPIPFLLALACAANVGSAATLIGNPQNMLIGQTLQLSFAGYTREAALPTLVGLLLVWAFIAWIFKHAWSGDAATLTIEAPPFDRWQTLKGLLVTLAVVLSFLVTDWPRELVALAAAGALLVSRRMASRDMLRLVDWHLLVLFISLFIVNRAIAQSGFLSGMLMMSRAAGADLTHAPTLFTATAVLSNLVSNVPAVMLLLPAARDALDGAVLALSSTLAGNLIIVGSIANIIVVDQAARFGVTIDWRTHARVGVPVTLTTLGVAAAWLAGRGW